MKKQNKKEEIVVSKIEELVEWLDKGGQVDQNCVYGYLKGLINWLRGAKKR